MNRSVLAPLVVLVLTTLGWPPARALAGEAQFQVNTYIANVQTKPALAAAASGNFVVVWRSFGAAEEINSRNRIQGRLFDANVQPAGAAINLDLDEACGSQWWDCKRDDPAVDTLPSGGFVATWAFWQWGPSPTWGRLHAIRARLFAGDGTALGPEFEVSPPLTQFDGTAASPVVAADELGGFVIAWAKGDSYNNEDLDIFARRYDASGAPLGPEFQVNTLTTGHQLRPVIAGAPGGGFVLLWQSASSLGGDGSGMSLQARRFDATGAALGPEFQVNAYTTGHQFRAAVGFDADGGFVAAWESWGSDGGDDSEGSVQARRFSADGTPAGPQFQVNETSAGEQGFPAVAVQPDGSFLVSWWSGADVRAWRGDLIGGYVGTVRARRFDPLGQPLGPELQINSAGVATPDSPALGALPGGNFVLAWASDVGSAGDELDGIEARLLTEDWIFPDGFETAGTSRWSSAQR
ncbi:MAG: hypothetical protein F9K18_10310 [Thermoanaerobaculia bacterium]|nr:MAG: hypothetical protein F9K18_10310 [Thermoanaerobaculia bacterium]